MAESDESLGADMMLALRATATNAMLAADIIRKFRGVVAASQVNRTSLQLSQVIQDVVETARIRIISEDIRINISVCTELPEILCDATLIKQVILNLIGNAIDAMLGQPARRLSILAYQSAADKVRVEVIDSGPGVRGELGGRIFDPYFTTRAGSLGMGLAICKAIIESHGETIGFDARPEGGTSFWFTLGTGSD